MDPKWTLNRTGQDTFEYLLLVDRTLLEWDFTEGSLRARSLTSLRQVRAKGPRGSYLPSPRLPPDGPPANAGTSASN